jgi:hypothetical protein
MELRGRLRSQMEFGNERRRPELVARALRARDRRTECDGYLKHLKCSHSVNSENSVKKSTREERNNYASNTNNFT